MSEQIDNLVEALEEKIDSTVSTAIEEYDFDDLRDAIEERVAESIEVDYSEIVDNLDMDDIASYVSSSDVANDIDLQELSENIDADEVADYLLKSASFSEALIEVFEEKMKTQTTIPPTILEVESGESASVESVVRAAMSEIFSELATALRG